MSAGGSRVPIPDNVRLMIQHIKEITGEHNDDDIYALLKECNMDPNETAQRLLYLDTFHVVKSKRRNKVVNNRISEQPRWKTGSQGQGARVSRGYYSSNNSYGGGGGLNMSARPENGGNNRMEIGSKPSLSFPEKTKNDSNPRVTNSSAHSVNGPKIVSDGSSSHERGTKASADASASDPVVVPHLNSWIPGGVHSEKLPAKSSAINLAGKKSRTALNSQHALGGVNSTKAMLKDSHAVEEKQPLEPSQASFFTTSNGPEEVNSFEDRQSSQILIGHSEGTQSLDERKVFVLEEATVKLEKLNISAYQPVIFPDHLRVPEDFKNGLTFGSLDNPLEHSNSPDNMNGSVAATELAPLEHSNGPDNKSGSMAATELLEGNGKDAGEIFMSNPSEFSTTPEGDNNNDLQSLPDVPDNSSPVKDVSTVLPLETERVEQELSSGVSLETERVEQELSSGVSLETKRVEQEILLPQGGPPPYFHTGPNYGYQLIQPMPGSQIVQYDGPEPQSGNSPVSSASGSMPTVKQPAGAPPPFPVFRQPYPHNYYPFGPYIPSYYLAPNAHQFIGHSSFPQQPSVGNLYLSPATTAAGFKFPVPQSKPGINAGNLTQVGIPSSFQPSLAVTSGGSAGNEDLTASESKDNSVRSTVQQGEGPLVWIPPPGRDLSGFHANSFYNYLPQGQQHVAFSPQQAGHAPIAGIYHPGQTVAATSTVHPYLRQSQSMAGPIESLEQSQHAVNWDSTTY